MCMLNAINYSERKPQKNWASGKAGAMDERSSEKKSKRQNSPYLLKCNVNINNYGSRIPDLAALEIKKKHGKRGH